MRVRKQKEYQEVMKLKAAGKMCQKDIAAKVGVPEKTVSNWLKNSPIALALKSEKAILKRIEKDGATLKPDELCRLSDAASKMHKIAFSID